MDVEFNKINLGEPLQIEIPVFYWLELLTWAETVTQSTPAVECTAISMLNTKVWEKITTEAYRKAALAHIAEHQGRITVVHMPRPGNGDDIV